VGRPGTIINLEGHAWASLGACGPARHDPLANMGQAGTILIRVGPSRARAGPARPAHLDIYSFRAARPHAPQPRLAPSRFVDDWWAPLILTLTLTGVRATLLRFPHVVTATTMGTPQPGSQPRTQIRSLSLNGGAWLS
jgi:hypothetical protein